MLLSSRIYYIKRSIHSRVRPSNRSKRVTHHIIISLEILHSFYRTKLNIVIAKAFISTLNIQGNALLTFYLIYDTTRYINFIFVVFVFVFIRINQSIWLVRSSFNLHLASILIKSYHGKRFTLFM